MNKTESIDPKYIVQYKGKNFSVINKNLARKQGLSDTALEAIKAYHILREAHIEELVETPIQEKKKLKQIGNNLTQIEFSLQKLWKFKKDRSYHRFWHLPKCSCPKMDNDDYLGTGYFLITSNCILHGK